MDSDWGDQKERNSMWFCEIFFDHVWLVHRGHQPLFVHFFSPTFLKNSEGNKKAEGDFFSKYGWSNFVKSFTNLFEGFNYFLKIYSPAKTSASSWLSAISWYTYLVHDKRFSTIWYCDKQFSITLHCDKQFSTTCHNQHFADKNMQIKPSGCCR